MGAKNGTFPARQCRDIGKQIAVLILYRFSWHKQAHHPGLHSTYFNPRARSSVAKFRPMPRPAGRAGIEGTFSQAVRAFDLH